MNCLNNCTLNSFIVKYSHKFNTTQTIIKDIIKSLKAEAACCVDCEYECAKDILKEIIKSNHLYRIFKNILTCELELLLDYICGNVNDVPTYDLQFFNGGNTTGCSNDRVSYSFILTNFSSESVPIGTTFNLQWTGLGANPVFSISTDQSFYSSATISNDGLTITTQEVINTFDMQNENIAVFLTVTFDSIGCEESEITLSLTSDNNYNITTEPVTQTQTYIPQQMYSCSGNTCVEDENGQYDHPSCYGNCNQLPPTMYSCSGEKCIEDENGQYDNNNCYGNCCLWQDKIISYECIPFVFLGEVNSQNDIIYNQAVITRADGICGENTTTEIYELCCLATGTYLGYRCEFGTKIQYYNNDECGYNNFYTINISDDIDCLGVSALLFILEYEDIGDAPFVYTDVTGWQTYIDPYYGRLTDITVSGNFMYFYGYNNTFFEFNYGRNGNNTVPVTLKSVTFTPDFNRPVSININTNDGINTAIDTIDLSTFTNLEIVALANNNLTSVIIGNNTNLLSLTVSDNPLATIDISLNTSLQSFYFSNTLINSLDVTNNTLLQIIQAEGGVMTELDVSNNTQLHTLYLANNPVTSMDISNNPLLEYVSINNANLDLASVNSILSDLVAFNLNNGYLLIGGGGCAAPTGQGIIDVATLQSRGWVVITS